MKGLKTLIKLNRRKLDELRRRMGILENQKNQLLAQSARLSKELEQEIAMASQKPEMGQFFGGFAKRIQSRQENIAAEVRKLDQQMAALRDEIANAYTDVKKFEIAEENARKREEVEQNRKETIILDDIAAQQYTRRQTEDQ
jgi:flagellar export protein FliJ